MPIVGSSDSDVGIGRMRFAANVAVVELLMA
jgi:hypothetical protein